MNCLTPKIIPVLSPDNSGEVFDIFVPCGKCSACQSAKRAEMVLRANYEYKNPHTVNGFFVTLTYDNQHLPCYYLDDVEQKINIQLQMMKKPIHRRWDFAHLDGDHISKFMRKFQRLCKSVGLNLVPDLVASDSIKENRNCRYILTGEYGDVTHRPHYHLFLFLPFPCNNETLKQMLSCCWEHGNIDIGDTSFNNAAVNYLAKHQMKDCSGVEFQQQVAPIFKRQSKYKGGIGVIDMCNDLSIHQKIFCDDVEKGVQIPGTEYLVGVPRAVRRKLKPDLLTSYELLDLSRVSEENFKKYVTDYLLKFPDLVPQIDLGDVKKSYRAIIQHSFKADQKAKKEHKIKKYYENIKKINSSMRSVDVR